MKFCVHCGNKLPDEGVKFCPFCGEKLVFESKAASYSAPSYGDREDFCSDVQQEISILLDELSNMRPAITVHEYDPEKDYWGELESLIGMDSVKEQLRKHIINHYVQRVRQVKHPDLQVVSPFNCIFKGRPGTGKTTVARIVAGILKEEGIIEKGCCVEMDASSITSGWVGFSAKFAKLAALQSLGGVLFIDEAYSLMNTKGTKGNSGAEVIDTLTPLMENYRDRLIVIFAGYENEMNTLLENTNPGFASRFKTEVLFQDYNASQMFSIFMSIAANNYYKITSSAQGRLAALLEYIEQNKDSNKRFANARTVRSLFETIRAKASDRMANDSKADYDVIKMEDVAIPIEELKAIGAI